MANYDSFPKAIAAFKSSSKTTMAAAASCAEFAITHFAKDGNLRTAQEFYDAMHKNYGRRNAFGLWLNNYAPINMKGGKFIKDKERAKRMEEEAGEDNGSGVNVDAAIAKPFWDFAPDPTRKPYDGNDVKVALMRVVKRFENDDRYDDHTGTGAAVLVAATAAIAQI